MNPNPINTTPVAVTKPVYPQGNPNTTFSASDVAEAISPALRVMNGNDSATEVIAKRTANSKIFQQADGSFQVVIDKGLVHYQDGNGIWQEINLQLTQTNGKYVVTKAPYSVEVFTDRVGYSLMQPDGTNFSIELVQIGGVAVNNSLITTQIDPTQIFYNGLAPNLAFKVLLFASRPDIYTQISDATAPTSFTWLVKQQGNFGFTSVGQDGDHNNLEITTSQTAVDATSFTYTETFTGRVSRKDPTTRKKTWYTDPTYPLILDPTVTINIANNLDDGEGSTQFGGSAQWVPNTGSTANIVMNKYAFGKHYPGWRFLNIGVPASATINSAFLKVRTVKGNSTKTGDVYADQSNNAIAWSNASNPINITAAGAHTSTTFTNSAGASKLISIAVKSQVQSVVNIAGWGSTHAMRFFVKNVGGGTQYQVDRIYDYNVSPAKAAQLVINYTTSGGGGGGAAPIPPQVIIFG